MNLHTTTKAAQSTDEAMPKRQLLAALATAAILGGVAIGISLAHSAKLQRTAGRPSASVSGVAAASAPVLPAPAFAMTYYLVHSQAQADQVRAEIEAASEEAAASGGAPAPSTVMLIDSPEEQAMFEAGINECAADPDCLANRGNVVDLAGGE
jgi:hypothetical protein